MGMDEARIEVKKGVKGSVEGGKKEVMVVVDGGW